MKLNTKIVSGLLATSALAFGVAVQASPPQGMQDKPGMACEHEGMGIHRGMHRMGDPAARAEQHLAQLKSQLKITAQQEPLWTAFAEKAKAQAGQGMMAKRDAMQQPMPAPERMAQMTAKMKERVAAMESTHESFKRLYEALTPEQKAIADKPGFMGGGMMSGRGAKPQGGKPMPPAQNRS
jgi:protein CpxP